MNTIDIRSLLSFCGFALIALFIAPAAPAGAAPGAHGAGGEHLDAAAQAGGAAVRPRLETKTELFELVATLGGGELSIMIDRFDTNEPVLHAKVEVESGALKARATFHADMGDYAVEDPAFLKALAVPGAHAIVFTVRAGQTGQESDLLEGTLTVAPATPAHAERDAGHHLLPGGLWYLAGVLAVGLFMLFLVRGRMRRSQSSLVTGGR